MKTYYIWIVIVLIINVSFFANKYETSPGFVPESTWTEFEKTRQHCFGISIPLDLFGILAIFMLPDAPAKSFCIGYLK